jgi:hypothetical protein
MPPGVRNNTTASSSRVTATGLSLISAALATGYQ